MSLQSVIGGVGDLMGAFQDTPQVSPYYGAHYLTPDKYPGVPKPMWVDANGQEITDPSFTSLPMQHQQSLASTPYNNLHWYNKITPEGQVAQRADMVAQQFGGQQSQQRAAESLATQSALQNKLAGANTLIGQSPTVQRMLAAQGDLSGSGLQSWNTATAQENAGVPGAEAGAIKDVALRTQAMNNPDANNLIGQTGLTQANIANQRANEEQALLPGERELQQLGQGRQWWDTAHIPSMGPNQPVIGPDGNITMQRNYTGSLQNQLIGSVLGGGSSMGGGGLANPYGGPAVMGGGTAGQGSGVQPIVAPASGAYYPPPASAMQQSQGGNPNIIGQVPGHIGRPDVAASQGTGDESEDNYLTVREKAAHDSALAKHKLIGAHVKASQAELEHQKQALIEARQGQTIPGTLRTIGNAARDIGSNYLNDYNYIFNNPHDPNWTGPAN